MLAVLPPETWDMIIDQLIYEYETLAACRLVCRQWRPRAWRVLRKGLDFYGREDVLYVAKVARTIRSKGPRKVDLFGGKEDERGPISHLAAFVAMFAGRWTRIEDMWIREANWGAGVLGPDTLLYLSAFTSITALHLYGITFPTVVTFGHLVCALPNLGWLDCDSLCFSMPFSDPLVFSKWVPKEALHRLQLRDCPIEDIVGFLSGTRISDHITQIECSDVIHPFRIDTAHTEALNLLLSTVASLDALSFDIDLAFEPAVEVTMGSRDENILKLKKLNIGIFLNDGDSDYSWLMETLSRVASYTIRTIELQFYFDLELTDRLLLDKVTASLDHEFCMQLEQVFALPVFANLEEVTYRLGTDSYNHIIEIAWSAAITTRFPKLDKRGILLAITSEL